MVKENWNELTNTLIHSHTIQDIQTTLNLIH